MEQMIPKSDNPDSADQTIVPKRNRILENMEPMLIEDEHCELPGSGSNDCLRTVAKSTPVILSKEFREKIYASYLECQERTRNSYIPPRYIGDDGLGKEIYTSENMKQITEDLLGHTHFEKLYRGRINDQVVVVKMCNFKCNLARLDIDWILRIIEEIKFLEDPSMKGHPNLVNIMGYCEEGKEIGVVYDLDPLDTLRSLISKGSLNWKQTFKIALELAQLVAWLHDFGYLVRNLAPAHIIIDKNFKPRFVDLMMLTGGIMGDRISRERGYWSLPLGYGPQGIFEEAYDVYVYGQILISLIAKKVYVPHVPDCDQFIAEVWAKKAYNERGGSFLHESLQEEIGDVTGKRITELAMHCIADKDDERPKMKEIVKTLINLMNHPEYTCKLVK